MLKKARKAFKALTDAFEFGDGSALTNVDIASGFVSVDALPSLLRGNARILDMFVARADIGAVSGNVACDPRTPGDFDEIYTRSQTTGITTGVEADEDYLVLNAGITAAATASAFSAGVLHAVNANFSTGAGRQAIAVWDTQGNGVAYNTDGPVQVTQWPYFGPAPPDDDGTTLSCWLNSSGAVTLTLWLQVMAIPRGLWVP